MNSVLVGAVGFLLGALVVWIVFVRMRVKTAMVDELERDRRLGMRRFLGHALPTFSPVISSASPQFCTVYGQASDAESYGLDQVCGVGYGRSLEFLIKDYAKREAPGAEAAIEKAPLASCIREYITDPAVRDSADLARWLRNDETHYIRKYSGHDIQDLKRLIALTIALIENAEQRKGLEQRATQEKASFGNSRGAGGSRAAEQ